MMTRRFVTTVGRCAIALWAFSAVGCATNPVTGKRQLALISEAQEIEMGREADKAAALRVVAARTSDPALFEQAQGMALAARVRGDSLAPVQASLELADALWTVDPANARAALLQAYETALRVSIK